MAEKNVERMMEILRKYKDDNLILSKLNDLSPEGFNRKELAAWYNFRGSLYYKIGNFNKARAIFEEGLDTCPKDTILSFNMGVLEESQGNISAMITNFNQVFDTPDNGWKIVGPRNVLIMVKLCYLWDRYKEGIRYLQPIFDAYRKNQVLKERVGITDDLPFYGETFSNLAILSYLSDQAEIAILELEDARVNLKDIPLSQYEATWNALINNDWSMIEETLEHFLKLDSDPTLKSKSPNGFSRVRLNLIKARKKVKYNKAIDLLERIQLDDDDFAWLKDIILLGKVELAELHGKSDDKGKYMDDFFSIRPKLFDLSHVFNFNFIEIQEKLKKRYQKSIQKE